MSEEKPVPTTEATQSILEIEAALVQYRSLINDVQLDLFTRLRQSERAVARSKAILARCDANQSADSSCKLIR